ncbi:MAG TPA: DUF6285 domain-containing protein [Longimicrobiales bacterium]
MKNRPHAPDLLAIAREVYNTEILPAVPVDKRYAALMIANAMAIAQREIEAGEEPAQAELARLRSLFDESAREVHGRELDSALADCNRRLARAIRSGRYDEERAALLAHLRRTVEEKLAISNPKALAGK